MKKWVLFLSFIFVFSIVLSFVSAWDSGWVQVGTVNKCCEAGCGGGAVCNFAGGFCNTDGNQYNFNWLSLANVCSGGDGDGDYKFLCQGGSCNLLRGAGFGEGPLPDLIPGNYYVSLQADWDGFTQGYLKVGASSTLNYGDDSAEKIATNSFNDNPGIITCTFRDRFNFATSANGKVWVEAAQLNSGQGSVQVYKFRVSDTLPSDTTYYCEDEVTITRTICTSVPEICDGADSDCDSIIDNGACGPGGVCTPAGDCQGNLICDSTGHCNPLVQNPSISNVNWLSTSDQIITNVNLGTGVVMNVSGSNLNGQYINYTVSNLSGPFYSIIMQLTGLSWTPNLAGNYTFKATVVSNSVSATSGILRVINNTVSIVGSYCVSPGNLWYDNATGGNYSTLTTEFCGGADRIAGGLQDCCPTTGGTYQCVTSGSDPGCKIISTNTLYCNYYNTSNSCNTDSLTLRLNEYQYGAQGCGTTISNGSAQYNISCVCNWDSNRCKFGKNVTTSSGGTGPGNEVVSSCIFDTVLGQCVDGQQTATTIGKLTSGNDPSCKNETITIPCGRKVLDLPFFGLWQFTLSLFGIALIYALFSRRLIDR